MLEINSGACHIWYFSSNDVDTSLANLLSKEEQVRYQNYKFLNDKKRFLKSATMLRLLLSMYTGINIKNLVISRVCKDCGGHHAKPRLINVKNIKFSISYSKDIILIAFYKNFDIGIDIEFMKYNFPFEELIEDTMTIEEIKKHNVMNSDDKKKNFYLHWTAKEALTKSTARGMNDNFNAIEIQPCNESLQVVKYPEFEGSLADISLKSIIFQEAYMLSLVVQDSLKDITFYDENEIRKYI